MQKNKSVVSSGFYDVIRKKSFFRDKCILLLFLAFCLHGYAQEKITVTGVVMDDFNETLIGVSVVVKGNNSIGTVTGIDGDYSITVDADTKALIFSYAGMNAQEVALDGKTTIDVKLSFNAQEIDEVIVTGYQKIDRKFFTGSASIVKAENAKVDGIADVSRMLEGKAAGVQLTNVSGTFGAAPKLRVRGASSIYGNANPLWVIDGVIQDELVNVSASDLSSGNAATLISSAVAGLNADDIESFQILKDASATALYGSKAMNGVIVITTKKGKKGDARVSYTGEFTMRAKPYYGTYDIMNSQDQMSVYKEMMENKLFNPSDVIMAQDGGIFTKWGQMLELQGENGQFLSPNIEAEKINYLRQAELRNTDWFDELFRYSLQQNHSVSISSGSEKATNYTSFSYFGDPGWTDVDKVERFTLNTNTSYNITQKLSFGIQGNASIRKQTAPGTFNRQVNVIDGEYSRDFDINPFSYALNTSRTMDANTFYRRNYADFNIKNEMANNFLDLDMLDTKVQFDLSYKPIAGLELAALGAVRYMKTTREHKILNNSNMAEAYRSMETTTIRQSNNFLWQDPDNLDALPMVVMGKGGFYNTQDNSLYSYYGRFSANYIKSIQDDHIINVLGGTEIRNTDRLSRFNNGYGYLWGSDIAVTDYRILRKVIDAGSNYFGMEQTYDRQAGFFGTGTYSYMGTYTLNGTIRTEGTNQMGRSNTARWLPTWNISASWNVMNEAFMNKQDFISALTLRGTYGLTAIMSPSANALAVYNATSTYRPYQEDRESILYIASLANDELTWEKMLETNVGFDLSILKNRFSIGFDAYWRDCFDLIGVIRTSGMGGEHQKYANFADMKTSGVEFTLNTTNIQQQNFSWSTNFTFSFNKNKVTDLKSEPSVIDLVGMNGAPKEGYSQSGLFSIPFAGLDRNGHPTFYDENGNTVYFINFQGKDASYLKYEGQLDPKFSGGFENSFTYKDWKLDLFFTYQGGNVIRLYPSFSAHYSDIDAMSKSLKDRWIMPGDEKTTTIPSIPSAFQLQRNSDLSVAYNAYNFSTERVAKGDFVRLKDITLTYNVKKNIAEKLGLSTLQLRGVASNIYLIYSDKALNGQDPEFSRSGGVAMPMPRQFTLSVRAGF